MLLEIKLFRMLILPIKVKLHNCQIVHNFSISNSFGFKLVKVIFSKSEIL